MGLIYRFIRMNAKSARPVPPAPGLAYAVGMSPAHDAKDRAAQRHRNLLAQEYREMRERVKMGGLFYPLAAFLAFVSTDVLWRDLAWAVAVTMAFGVLAALRFHMPYRAEPDPPADLRGIRRMWTLVLVTTTVWGVFSAWVFGGLPAPAPLVTLLFSGAFGMAIAHTLAMRPWPSAVAILCVMLPSMAMLWRTVAPGVALMWGVYGIYMLLVMVRSHREFRARLSLEEDLRHQRDLFEVRSRIDDLTGLANRRAFNQSLSEAIARERAGVPLALLILDIDHFKRINDALGHLAGDASLVALARRLEAHFDREGDLCVRLGGEEFGVLLACDGDTARARAEAFRAALAESPLSVDGQALAMTASIGCGAFDPARHEDGDALYREVDGALYVAKQRGRNCVVGIDVGGAGATQRA